MAERERRAHAQLRVVAPTGAVATAATPSGAQPTAVESNADRLRILFVGHRFPPDGTGGYELHCAAVRDHLRSRGHDVCVLAGARKPLVAPTEPGVRRTLRWQPPGRRLDRAAAWEFERHNRAALDAELDRFRPHVVCWWRLGEMSLSLVDHAGARGVPALGYVGDGWLHEGLERDPWTPYRERPLAFAATTWVFNSHWLRERTRSAGVELEETLVLSPGVDLRRFTPRAAREWRGSLLYAGRLTPAKGVDVALRALARLPGERLLVVGDGSADHVAELEELAVSLGVATRVEWRPAVPAAALACLYRDADAVLFPVRWQEPFGLVPLEAMASGTPVVATGTGGSAEYLVRGENALVVAADDPDALAGAVARLAADRDLRARLRHHGLLTAAGHDRDERSSALERLLRERAQSAGEGAAAGRPPPGRAVDPRRRAGEEAVG